MLDTMLDWVGAGGLATAVILCVQLAWSANTHVTEWIAVAAIAPFPALRFLRPRFGNVVTAQVVLAYTLALCMYTQCFRGPTPATALVQAAAIVLAGVFFGPRGIEARRSCCIYRLHRPRAQDPDL